jgi:hypothetical protein
MKTSVKMRRKQVKGTVMEEEVELAEAEQTTLRMNTSVKMRGKLVTGTVMEVEVVVEAWVAVEEVDGEQYQQT